MFCKGHLMALRRFASGLVATLVMSAAGVAAAQPAGADEEAARAALKEWMAASPEYAKLQYDLVKAQAGLAVRIERLVMIGLLCERLSEDDSRLIIDSAREEMAFGLSVLSEAQQADFALYYEGLRQARWSPPPLSLSAPKRARTSPSRAGLWSSC